MSKTILEYIIGIINEFINSKNKINYLYKIITIVNLILIVFVFLNHINPILDKQITEYLLKFTEKMSLQNDIIICIIISLIAMYKLFKKIYLKNEDKIKGYERNNILLTALVFVELSIKICIAIKLLSLLVTPFSLTSLIFYILLILYYLYIFLNKLYNMSKKINSLSHNYLSYFDCNNQRLYKNDYVIYRGLLYQIKKRNDIYYICRGKDRIGYRVTIPLEEALSDTEGKLIFYQHGNE